MKQTDKLETGRNVSTTFVILNSIVASRLSRKAGIRLSVHGISFTEYLVMQFLGVDEGKEVSRIELAEYLGMSASGVTRLLAPMEKNGVVEKVKNPRDSRQSRVKLTQTGEQLFKDAETSFEHITAELLQHLNAEQQAIALEIFKKVL